VRPVDQVERRAEAEAIEAAHQRLVAEDRARGGLDDRLEGRFDHQLGERDDLAIPEAAKGKQFGGGHARLRDMDIAAKFLRRDLKKPFPYCDSSMKSQ
jgi:hypothetical protein